MSSIPDSFTFAKPGEQRSWNRPIPKTATSLALLGLGGSITYASVAPSTSAQVRDHQLHDLGLGATLGNKTAAVEAVPFLFEILHYTRRGDRFGPQRRQLALWGLARVALFHNIPEAYHAMQGGLTDRNADVRYATVDMILNAYLRAGRDVPQDVVDRLRHVAWSDPDDSVRHAAQRHLREPWATT